MKYLEASFRPSDCYNDDTQQAVYYELGWGDRGRLRIWAWLPRAVPPTHNVFPFLLVRCISAALVRPLIKSFVNPVVSEYLKGSFCGH